MYIFCDWSFTFSLKISNPVVQCPCILYTVQRTLNPLGQLLLPDVNIEQLFLQICQLEWVGLALSALVESTHNVLDVVA